MCALKIVDGLRKGCARLLRVDGSQHRAMSPDQVDRHECALDSAGHGNDGLEIN